MLRIVAIVLVCGMLVACSPHAPSPTAASSATPAPSATNIFAGTPLSAYGHDLNRAKNVQNIVNQRANKVNAALDAATGSSG